MKTMEAIRKVLDANGGYQTVKKLSKELDAETRRELGIKRRDTTLVIMEKLEAAMDGSFVFVRKGRSIYIMEPTTPAELVVRVIASGKEIDYRSLPLTKAEFEQTLEELTMTEESKGDRTEESFLEAVKELESDRKYVSIWKIRRKLNWTRDEFDGMVRKLRDERTIELHTLDASTMTPDKVSDSFVDENGFRKGSLTLRVA